MLLVAQTALPLAASSRSGTASDRTPPARKTRVWGFCRRPAHRARFLPPQVAKSCRVARPAITKSASGRSVGLNWYAYANGNPVSYVDPDGQFAHILIGSGIGAIVGVGAQAIGDLIRGEVSGWNEYAGALVGGAVTGGLVTATGGASLAISATARVAITVASGATGAASGNLFEQGFSDRAFSGSEFAIKTTIGAATSLIPAPVIRVPGLNAGNGSWSHVAKTQMTKLSNGTTSSISSTTLGKIIGANVYRESTTMVYDGAAEAGYDQWIEPRIRSAENTNSSYNSARNPIK